MSTSFRNKCILTVICVWSSHAWSRVFFFMDSDLVWNMCEFTGVRVSHIGDRPNQGILGPTCHTGRVMPAATPQYGRATGHASRARQLSRVVPTRRGPCLSCDGSCCAFVSIMPWASCGSYLWGLENKGLTIKKIKRYTQRRIWHTNLSGSVKFDLLH